MPARRPLSTSTSRRFSTLTLPTPPTSLAREPERSRASSVGPLPGHPRDWSSAWASRETAEQDFRELDLRELDFRELDAT